MKKLSRGILAGFVATLVMTLAMFAGRFYLGTPFIPELIARWMYFSEAFNFLFHVFGEYVERTAFAVGVAIHLGIGTLFGVPFIHLRKALKIRNPTLTSLLYSVLLWFIFSALFLPVLGFGFFGNYFAGIPAISEAALLICYLIYGLVLYLFSVGIRSKAGK